MSRTPFQITNPQTNTMIFGFDSAWTDAAKMPGAICAVAFDGEGRTRFVLPRLVSFAQSLDFIASTGEGYGLRLVALDQPTIVPNATGMRPVERVAGSLVSYVGGGVQPANRSKLGMFCDASPIWRFRAGLDAQEDPEGSRTASEGLFLIEVFPALALAGLSAAFAQRLSAPKYNPANRRRFKLSDWESVARLVGKIADDLGVPELSRWALSIADLSTPKKADQDMLDSAICALVGVIWRGCARPASAILGDLKSGYMVAPVSIETRARLSSAAQRYGVPLS